MKRSVKKPAPQQRTMLDLSAQHIRRTWGDLPVVDAEKDLRVFIAPEDVAKATKKDPGYCVFAQACRRQFHATKVLFFRRVAYVELPTESGERRVERFIMGDGMRPLIESFDRGQGVIPKAGFLLRAPGPAHRFEAKKAKSKRDRETTLRRKLEGRSTPSRGISKEGGKAGNSPIWVDLSVRNGSGAVHFTQAKK